MTLDHSTLKFAGGFVTAESGLFLMMHWWRDRRAWSAFWWALAHSLAGIGIAVMATPEMMSGRVLPVAAPAMIGLGSALMCMAAWIFNRGSVDPRIAAAAIALSFGLAVVAGSFGYARLEIALESGISGGLCLGTAALFWSARHEELPGRLPMIVVLSLQAFALILVMPYYNPTAMLEGPGLVIGLLTQLVYAAGSAVFLVTMLKERTEAAHRAASLTDPLTGLPNRRAFMNKAQRFIDRCQHDQIPVSLVAFDLDKFKTINDTFGHPFGDEVLRTFGDVLSRVVRPTDPVARVGGEEFLVLLPGCGSGPACEVANRVRVAFEVDAIRIWEQTLNGTVSAGVATVVGGCQLSELTAAADDALYEAKGLGRNRVVLAAAPEEIAA